MKSPRILITRPAHRAKTLVNALISAGGLPILVPTIELGVPKNLEPLLKVCKQLSHLDMAIFISPNAVDKAQLYWPTSFAQSTKLVLPSNVTTIAIGPGTQERLHHHGMRVNDMPKENFCTEGLLELPILQNVSNKRIAIFCGEGGRTDLAQILTQRGAQVTLAYAYCRRCPNLDLQKDLVNWQQQGIDVVVGTSAESLYNLLKMVGEAGANWLKQLQWLVVSQRMADLTKTLDFAIAPLIASNAANEAIFQALRDGEIL